jgi:hypothetical protein
MELQKSESTGCLQADTNGSAADLPAQRAGFWAQCEEKRLPAYLRAFVVMSHQRTRLKS